MLLLKYGFCGFSLLHILLSVTLLLLFSIIWMPSTNKSNRLGGHPHLFFGIGYTIF
jgi:hypothetical protein